MGLDYSIGAIQVLRNAMGVSAFLKKSVTKVYSSMLFSLRGVGGGHISMKNVMCHLNDPIIIAEKFGISLIHLSNPG